jgi:hypothetical protein
VQISLYNRVPIIWTDNSTHPSHGIDNYNTLLPIGVRADDCYLGACWMASDLKKNLHPFFSADIHPDGFPFPDRAGCGLAFMPRAHIKDFPDAENGKMVHDRRVGYIRCPDGQIVILGGEDFRAEAVPDYIWANFHHWFIDVTARSQTVLRCVTDEPAEIARRPPPKANSALRPEDAVSTFEATYNTLLRAVKAESGTNLVDAFHPLTPHNRLLVLNNLPVRGYDPQTPTFELVSHAMMAGKLHHNAAVASIAQSTSSVDCRTPLLENIKLLLRDLEHGADSASRAVAARQLLTKINELVANVEEDKAFAAELFRRLAEVPSADRILGALPESILPMEDRGMTELAGNAILTETDMAPIIYSIPNQNLDPKQTDQLLMKLMTAPLQHSGNVTREQGQSNANSGSPPKRKRKRRGNQPEVEEYPPHPEGKTWKYIYEKTAGETRLDTNRRVCRTLGMTYTGLSLYADFTAAIEKHINAKGLGLSNAGRQFGIMVDLV